MGTLGGTLWAGIALTRRLAAADPDAPPRTVALPASWDDLPSAGAALAALAPGAGPISLPRAAEAWIAPLLARGRAGGLLSAGEDLALADALRALLLTRRGCPGLSSWRGVGRAEHRFVLHLPAFLDPVDQGLDLDGFAEACAVGVRALDCLEGGRATRLRLGFADLAGLLAMIGLKYGSADARAVAAGVAALARGAAEAESGRLAERLGAREPAALLWPAPPAATPLPGLAAAARAALDAAAAAPGLRHAALLALAPADAAEALLGAETAGLQPAGGPTRPTMTPAGLIELPTRAALRAARFGAERAGALLAPATPAERAAMRAAVGPFLHAPPPTPAALPDVAVLAPTPTRTGQTRTGQTRTGQTRTGPVIQVAWGGRRITLRTESAGDDRLLGVALTMPREPPASRAMLDAVAKAISLGLEHGVPLGDFVHAYAYSGPGPTQPVIGDPHIARATSVLDWAFRRLARDWLGQALPCPPAPSEAPDDGSLPLLRLAG